MEHVMAVKESKKREKQKQGKKWEGKKIKTGGGRSFPGAFSILLCLGGVRKSATDDLKDWVGGGSGGEAMWLIAYLALWLTWLWLCREL